MSRGAVAAGARAHLTLLVLVAALPIAACARSAADRLPAGTLWEGDAAAARPLLAGLLQLRDTPAALVAAELQARLAGCRKFVAYCAAGARCSLAASLRCDGAAAGELARAADAVRGDAGWLLAHRDGRRRLAAWGTAHDGDVRVRAELRLDPGTGTAEPWEALLPASDAPAAPAIAGAPALLALRVRSDLGAAPLRALTSGDWMERLYSVKGQLFRGMTLEGTSELAVYPPQRGELIPPLALAVHVKSRERAQQAMEELLQQVRARWPVSREPWQRAAASGACLSDLNVLPGLAPCYLATDRAVVLGWNRRSVELALAPYGRAAPNADESELLLHLDELPAADALLRAAYGGAPTATPYPWRLLRVRGGREGGAYRLELALTR